MLEINNNCVAVIPARIGSKRIKNKNIRIFFGKPIIYYSIKIARSCGLFKDIFVSTDSEKIKKICLNLGVKIISRPKKLALDHISTLDVINHAARIIIKKYRYKYLCCIYPCTPLLTFNILNKAFKYIKNFDYVFPVSKGITSNKSFLNLDKKSRVVKVLRNYEDGKQCYSDTGQFYLGKIKAWEKKNPIFSKKSKTFFLKKNQFVDVNYNSDWKKLKILFQNRFIKTNE